MVEIKEYDYPPNETIRNEIASLYYEVFNRTYPEIQKSMDRCIKTVNYWMKNCEKVILVHSESDGSIIAFMILSKDFLDELYIHADFQGKGIGKLLVEKAKGLYDNLSLYTLKQNEKAISFYMKNGFIIKKYGIAEDEQVEDVYMEWEGGRK